MIRVVRLLSLLAGLAAVVYGTAPWLGWRLGTPVWWERNETDHEWEVRTGLDARTLHPSARGDGAAHVQATVPAPQPRLVVPQSGRSTSAVFLVALGLSLVAIGAWPSQRAWTPWERTRLACVCLAVVLPSVPFLAWMTGARVGGVVWIRFCETVFFAGLGLIAANLVLGIAALVTTIRRDLRGQPPDRRAWWAAGHLVVLPFACWLTALVAWWFVEG